jgi:hypothetical protein
MAVTADNTKSQVNTAENVNSLKSTSGSAPAHTTISSEGWQKIIANVKRKASLLKIRLDTILSADNLAQAVADLKADLARSLTVIEQIITHRHSHELNTIRQTLVRAQATLTYLEEQIPSLEYAIDLLEEDIAFYLSPFLFTKTFQQWAQKNTLLMKPFSDDFAAVLMKEGEQPLNTFTTALGLKSILGITSKEQGNDLATGKRELIRRLLISNPQLKDFILKNADNAAIEQFYTDNEHKEYYQLPELFKQLTNELTKNLACEDLTIEKWTKTIEGAGEAFLGFENFVARQQAAFPQLFMENFKIFTSTLINNFPCEKWDTTIRQAFPNANLRNQFQQQFLEYTTQNIKSCFNAQLRLVKTQFQSEIESTKKAAIATLPTCPLTFIAQERGADAQRVLKNAHERTPKLASFFPNISGLTQEQNKVEKNAENIFLAPYKETIAKQFIIRIQHMIKTTSWGNGICGFGDIALEIGFVKNDILGKKLPKHISEIYNKCFNCKTAYYDCLKSLTQVSKQALEKNSLFRAHKTKETLEVIAKAITQPVVLHPTPWKTATACMR